MDTRKMNPRTTTTGRRTGRLIAGLAVATLAVTGTGIALADGPAVAAPPTTRPAAGATTPATSPLSDTERAELLRMADEERMARDLYTSIAAQYPDATTFSRIARSEQRHEEQVLALLDRYGLTHPSSVAGTYDTAEVQKLHDGWLARARTSREAAYQVGVDLEQADIVDLRSAIDESDNADLDQVYGNLLTASEHHRAAFTAGPDATIGLGANGPGTSNGQGRMYGQGGMNGQGGTGQGRHDGSCLDD